MKETIIKYSCDICGSKNSVTQQKISVVFTTDQSEGRPIKHYFNINEIDLCGSCLGEALRGKQIFASGVMGNNTYWFKRKIKIKNK